MDLEFIKSLIDQKALFIVNHSAGKDSQAMTIYLSKLIPKDQMVIIHSHLPGVEWPGVKEHIISNSLGIHVSFTQANKTFLGMVEKRGKFPSPKYRQCTSDLKRGPIQKFINNYSNKNGFNIVVNCIGLRAEESPARSKKDEFRGMPSLSCKHRNQFEWLPIHRLTSKEVFKMIEEAGQKPHWAYEAGMTRLSCCFCIMASKQDLKTAARLRPELFQTYVALEKKINYTMMMPEKGKEPLTLEQIVNS